MFTKRILLCIFILPLYSYSQELLVQAEGFGFNCGLNMAFGTHFQRLGLNFNLYYNNAHFQANTEGRIYYSFRNLGPRLRNPELVISQGVLYAYGSTSSQFNPFLTCVSNQTAFQNSVAYAYNFYFNTVKTSQQTGSFAFQFNTVSIITENDLLARPSIDRYRTGAFMLQYQYLDQFQAALNCSLWTGQMGQKHSINNPNFYSGCYMDTVGGHYASTSHGLLSAQFKYDLGYSQNVQANVGIDAEQVRNAVQNHVVHDLRFLPRRFPRKKNCHIPMIDSNGHQYLYEEGQEPRSARLFLNAYSNASLFY